jgi:branched-chain amino acid transport system permease protein
MDMKRDYYEDIRLFGSGVVLFWSLLLMAFLYTLPLYLRDTASIS